MHKLHFMDKFCYEDFCSPCILLPQLKMISKYQSKIISKSLHVKSLEDGYELQFISGPKKVCTVSKCNGQYCFYKIQTIFLYLHHKKFSPYKYSLVYTLFIKSTIKSTTMLLGQPPIKSKYLIECIWEHLGIGVTFIGHNWKNQELLIQYLYLFEPENKYINVGYCATCKKQIQLNNSLKQCVSCEIIRYCSNQCMDRNYRYHQMYCQQIQE